MTKHVMAGGASRMTSFTRVYVGALMSLSIGGAGLLTYGGVQAHGGIVGADALIAFTVIAGWLIFVAAVPMLVVVAVAYVIFGGLK